VRAARAIYSLWHPGFRWSPSLAVSGTILFGRGTGIGERLRPIKPAISQQQESTILPSSRKVNAAHRRNQFACQTGCAAAPEMPNHESRAGRWGWGLSSEQKMAV